MRKSLLAAGLLMGAVALAGCQPSQPPQSAQAPQPPPPAPPPAQPMEAKPTTEAGAFKGGEGAYGMPAAPIPYEQLAGYEQRQQMLTPPPADGQPGTRAAPAGPAKPRAYRESAKEQDPKTRRESDSVFY